MNRYVWKCAACTVTDLHDSQSTNPYLLGFEIYTEHARLSPGCKNRLLDIAEGDAPTLFHSTAFQTEVLRMKRLDGAVELRGNLVTIYRGSMPESIANAFVGRLQRCDPRGLLSIVVSEKDRPQ